MTGLATYDICRSRSQQLRCSANYVIDIVTADLAAKEDGSSSCNYSPNDCFQSEISSVQSACAGKPACTLSNPGKTLSSCQNKPSSYFRIEYACVPGNLPEINTYDLCSNDSEIPDNVHRGYLYSPQFPTTPNNLSCTFQLQPSKSHQDIYLYVIEMGLNDPNVVGGSCSKDRLITTAGSTVREMCGLSFTNRILKTCHAPLTIELLRTADARGRGVKLYFEFRDRPADETCETIVTPSTPSPGSSTKPWLPSYFPGPSGIMVKTLCYPDTSGSSGQRNFQCPPNYVLAILRAFYGTGNRCTYTAGDCRHEADNVHRDCSGKYECSVPFETPIHLPDCPTLANRYLTVEYSCLPTLSIVGNITNLCQSQTHVLNDPSAVFQSDSYPSYTKGGCTNVSLTVPTGADLVIDMYLLDLSIDEPTDGTDTCDQDYLRLSYQCNNVTFEQKLCGTQPTKLLFSTCVPTDQIFISYSLTKSDGQELRGFTLLYHLVSVSALSSIRPPQPTAGPTKPSGGPDNSHIGAIVGGVIGGLLIALLLAAGVIYYLKYYRSDGDNDGQRVTYKPRQEAPDDDLNDAPGATSSIPYESLRNPTPISVDNPSYKARLQIDDTATDA